MTTFHEAIYYVGGTVEDVERLLKEYPSYLREHDENYKTLLVYASQLGRQDMVNFLYEKGAEVKYLNMFPKETITWPKCLDFQLRYFSDNSTQVEDQKCHYEENPKAKKIKLELSTYAKKNIDDLRKTDYLRFAGIGFETIETLPKGIKKLIINRTRIGHLVGLPETLETLEAELVCTFKGELTFPEKFPKSLKELNLSSNQLKEIKGDVLVLENLEYLKLEHNDLKELPKLHDNLGELTASYNLIEGIRALPSMIMSLDLSMNFIERICDLSSFEKLIYLNVGHNAIVEFPILPKGLKILLISNNYITGPFKFPYEVPDIKKFSITKNYIKQEYIKELKKNFSIPFVDQYNLKQKEKDAASTFFKYKNRMLLLCERRFNQNSLFHFSYFPLDLFKFIFNLAGIKKKLSFQKKMLKYRVEENDEAEEESNLNEEDDENQEISTQSEDSL